MKRYAASQMNTCTTTDASACANASASCCATFSANMDKDTAVLVVSFFVCFFSIMLGLIGLISILGLIRILILFVISILVVNSNKFIPFMAETDGRA